MVIVAAGCFSVTVSVRTMVTAGGGPPVAAASTAPPSTATTEYGERWCIGCGTASVSDTRE